MGQWGESAGRNAGRVGRQTPGAVPPGSVVGTPFIEATQPAPGTSPIVEVTPEVTEIATEEAIVPDEATLLLLNLRPDLETLANEMLGVGIRPEGWNGSIAQPAGFS